MPYSALTLLSIAIVLSSLLTCTGICLALLNGRGEVYRQWVARLVRRLVDGIEQ